MARVTLTRAANAVGSGMSPPGWTIFSAGCLIVLATLLAYANTFQNPFIFDDTISIEGNPTIWKLWPIWTPLCPPNNGAPVTGRPLLNLSLAINYAATGTEVWSYHATNLLIHVLAALLLFGILRRTFLLPVPASLHVWASTSLAFATALVWAIHPLQTESVTYIVQRAESLVSLFYLLTLYCFIRGADSDRGGYWHAGAVLACLLGMASKEVMVSAPLVVLLYDRAFLAGSFREAWRRRRGLYLALAATWLLLGWLVIMAGDRGNSVGFGAGIKVGSWAYLCTQFEAIVHYLRLCVWPSPLLLDYGREAFPVTLQVVPYAMAVVLLGLATVVALWRWPKIGFLGAWFFAILAPTSSVVPVATQVMAEHRMYLPSAAVVMALFLGGYLALSEPVRRGLLSWRIASLIGGSAAAAAALMLGIVTYQRNADYHSVVLIWQDTVGKAPHNSGAHNNLGDALVKCGQFDEAIAELRKALEIQPDNDMAHNNLGTALAARGHPDQAVAEFRMALAISPDYAKAHYNLGTTMVASGQFDEAISEYREALKISPTLAIAYNNLAYALANRGRLDEAIAEYRKALKIKPDNAEVRQYLDVVLSKQKAIVQALARRRESLRTHGNDIALANDTAWLLATCPDASIRNGTEAVELAQRAVKLSGGQEPAVLGTLAAAYAEVGQFPEAVKTARTALDLAAQNNDRALVESIKTEISLYEAGTPFRDMPQSSDHGSVRP